MAAASGAERKEFAEGEATEEQLLDVLYEIMAQGVDPVPGLSVGDVEGFLHEHARQKKDLGELLLFFECHGLPQDPAAYATDSELGELAHGLRRAREPNSSMFLLDDPKDQVDALPETPTQRSRVEVAVVADETSGVKALAQAAQVKPATPWLRYAVVALGVFLVAAFAQSLLRARDLERKLAEARLQQRTTDIALGELEKRAEGLRAELGRSEAEQRALAQRFESFASEEARERAADGAALKRLLGPRYDSLRSRELEHGQTSSR
jgi:hypothetical protein